MTVSCPFCSRQQRFVPIREFDTKLLIERFRCDGCRRNVYLERHLHLRLAELCELRAPDTVDGSQNSSNQVVLGLIDQLMTEGNDKAKSAAIDLIANDWQPESVEERAAYLVAVEAPRYVLEECGATGVAILARRVLRGLSRGPIQRVFEEEVAHLVPKDVLVGIITDPGPHAEGAVGAAARILVERGCSEGAEWLVEHWRRGAELRLDPWFRSYALVLINPKSAFTDAQLREIAGLGLPTTLPRYKGILGRVIDACFGTSDPDENVSQWARQGLARRG